jgi:trehalose 2-sulfotransferase
MSLSYLPARPKAGPAQPLRTCVICALPRSGSTFLSYGLEDTGVVGHPREYLGRRLMSQYAQDWDLPAGYSLGAFVQAMNRMSMTPNGVTAVKIHMYDFTRMLDRIATESGPPAPSGRPPGERELLERCFPRPRCVFLHRSDHVRQAVSFMRALDTMEWQRLRDDSAAPRQLVRELDINRIDPYIRQFRQQEQDWLSFFDRNSLDFIEIIYEDLVRDYRATIVRILDFLRITPPDGLQLSDPRTVRQSDAMTERAVARYAERLKRKRL